MFQQCYSTMPIKIIQNSAFGVQEDAEAACAEFQ